MHPLIEKYFSLIRRVIPTKKESTGSSVGLDIGISSCKLIELQKSADSFEVLTWAVEPVSNANHHQAISNIIKHIKTPEHSVYTSVHGKGTLIRFIEMPRMSIDELKNSFDIEADKYFPFPQDQIYTDCFILDPQGKDKQMPVMAAAAKKELIDDRVNILTSCGIDCDFISIDQIAHSNVIHLAHTDSDGEDSVLALLDVGEVVSSLLIAVNQYPRFTRDIYIGGRDFTKRISNTLGVDFDGAEKLKKDPGKKKDEISSACESVTMNMVQELRLSLDYFSAEYNIAIKTLQITGGGSLMQGLNETLESNLDLKIERWDPIGFVNIDAKDLSEELSKQSHQTGVALGLALYHYD